MKIIGIFLIYMSFWSLCLSQELHVVNGKDSVFDAQALWDIVLTQTIPPDHIALFPINQNLFQFLLDGEQQELKKRPLLDETIAQTLDASVTQTAIPDHVAIIPDGNRRFAKNHKYALVEGLRKATLGTVPMVTEFLWRSGVHTVSIWCFSTENWKRPIAEICDVMQVIAEGIEQALLPLCHRMEAKIVHLGRRDRLPSYVLQMLDYGIRQTSRYAKHAINLCIDYGGQDEVCRMIEKLQKRNLLDMPLGASLCSDQLDAAGQRYPSPDLIIRTSGEKRLSGFFLWSSAYSELYFFEKHFPDLTNADIKTALDDFAQRQRRYGK